jgi:hypothetical protein
MALVLAGSALLGVGLVLKLITPGQRRRDPRVAAYVKASNVALTAISALGVVLLLVGALTLL